MKSQLSRSRQGGNPARVNKSPCTEQEKKNQKKKTSCHLLLTSLSSSSVTAASFHTHSNILAHSHWGLNCPAEHREITGHPKMWGWFLDNLVIFVFFCFAKIWSRAPACRVRIDGIKANQRSKHNMMTLWEKCLFFHIFFSFFSPPVMTIQQLLLR